LLGALAPTERPGLSHTRADAGKTTMKLGIVATAGSDFRKAFVDRENREAQPFSVQLICIQ
jgi:hypothetical protein